MAGSPVASAAARISTGQLTHETPSTGKVTYTSGLGDILQRKSTAGTGLTDSYIYGANGPLVNINGGGTRSWLLGNTDGSVRSTFADSGVPSARSSYNAYGFPVERLGETGMFGYMGQLQDKDWNLTFMGHRWLDNGYSSFLSRDTNPGSPMTPLSMHPYEYGLDAPAMYSDTSGTTPGVACGAGMVSIGGQCYPDLAGGTIDTRSSWERGAGIAGDIFGEVMGAMNPVNADEDGTPCAPPFGFPIKLPINSDGSIATLGNDEHNYVCLALNPMIYSPRSPLRHQPRVIVSYDPRTGTICTVSAMADGTPERDQQEKQPNSGEPKTGPGSKRFRDLIRRMLEGKVGKNGIMVRPYAPEDRNALLSFLERMRKGGRDVLRSGSSEFDSWYLDAFAESIKAERPPSHFIAVTGDGEVVGYMMLSPEVNQVDRSGPMAGSGHSEARSKAIKLANIAGDPEAGPAMADAALQYAYVNGAGGVQAPLPPNDAFMLANGYVIDPYAEVGSLQSGKPANRQYYLTRNKAWLKEILRWSAFYNGKGPKPR